MPCDQQSLENHWPYAALIDFHLCQPLLSH